MAKRAQRPCAYTGCPNLTRERWCKDHQGERWAYTQRRKGTSTQRGYGATWQKLRKLVIARDSGLCQPCMKQGKVTPFNAVDHIRPKEQGGTDDMGNLQCICKACHDAKTARERRVTA